MFEEEPDLPLPEGFPEAMKSNEEFALFATRFCYNKPADFETFASETLRSNRAFMSQAVARNPVCFFAGAGNLARDEDIALVAFSHQIYTRDRLFGDYEEIDDRGYAVHRHDYGPELEFLRSVAAKAREKVLAFDGFTQGFLLGTIDDQCALSMLNQNPLKELIKELVGVPGGEEVGRLRAVSLNLLFTCLPDPNNLSLYCMDVPGRAFCPIKDYF